MGVKGDLKKAVLESIDHQQKPFEKFLGLIDGEEDIEQTIEGVADYLVKNSVLFPQDPLIDVDVIIKIELSKLQTNKDLGGNITRYSEGLVKLIEEYKEWLCKNAKTLRKDGFMLYKVKVKSCIPFNELYEIDACGAVGVSNDAGFYFQPLFWDPLLAMLDPGWDYPDH